MAEFDPYFKRPRCFGCGWLPDVSELDQPHPMTKQEIIDALNALDVPGNTECVAPSCPTFRHINAILSVEMEGGRIVFNSFYTV